MKKLLKKMVSFAVIGGLLLSTALCPAQVTRAAAVSSFKDVPKTHWAYTTIMEGVEKGYLEGFSNGTFKPNDSVTVAQFLKMVLLSMTEVDSSGKRTWAASKLALLPDWNLSAFKDSSISFAAGGKGQAWYENYVHTAETLSIIQAQQYDERFNTPLTRQEAAAILENLDSYFYGTLDQAYAEKAAPVLFKDVTKFGRGYDLVAAKVALRGIMAGGAGGYFNPKQAISRAEAAKITYVLAHPEARNPQKIDMTNIPYAMVDSPGYSQTVHVFANWEMKKVYDSLKGAQKSYPGYTQGSYGELDYYKSREEAEKHLEKQYYFDKTIFDNTIYFDIVFGFDGNVYNITLSSDVESSARGQEVLDLFLKKTFNNPSPVKEKILMVLQTEQKGGSLTTSDKVYEGRQVVISATRHGFISIGISVYQDK
ncbi:S-layer homology domain-containing protein [Paenibacillus sp. NFR01]|uniref:S-layer homology domain-containing protein n=1 Tax=Paenibacillus sp. NFR01 TaxID=1566279 RepID=UPI0008D0180F|nr:S-layer homology domain-containing protein [Paenibacillus sp. NFR01]SET95001.1 S-layer homology domain-containing protein [Paenibacillus sp. NFR01]